jgi:hypothetical protein
MLNLFTGIINKTSGSSLSALVGGRIYSGFAPPNAVMPYVVFFSVGGTPENTWTEDLKRLQMQFSIFSASEGMSEIAGIETALEALFDEQKVTVTGTNEVRMIKVSEPVQMVENEGTPDGLSIIQHWAVDYDIYIEAT